MVSAGEALGAAVHEGVLEKRRRTGGWKKKQFILTPRQLLYYDSMESTTPLSTLATLEIISVDKNEADVHHRGFFIALYRKKKEYRAATTDDRDAWIQALTSVAGVQKNDRDKDTIGDPTSTLGSETLSRDERPQAAAALNFAGSLSVADLRTLCDQMKKSMAWQVQISKSFTAKDVVDFIRKQNPAISHDQILQIGQDLVDNKLIVPLKSHVFDDSDSGRFKFVDAVAPKQPKNHLNMRGQSIADLMGNDHFDAKKYAEDFLRKHASEKIDAHCKKLVAQKDQTIEELKEEISSNYSSFIRASAEIKTMENSVSQLKTMVIECKRSIHTLKNATLDTSPGKRFLPVHNVIEKEEDARAKSGALDGFLFDLEVFLNERDFQQFTSQMLEYLQKQKQNPAHSSDVQHAKILELRSKFVHQMVEDFNGSLQASERMHKKEDHLNYLIQLGETQLATEMCLQNYSVRMALQLRHVPSYGNSLNYVINLSRTFFSSLLVCYEDYEHSFRGQSSSHFISLTVWISAQLERFAKEIIFHIFPNAAQAVSATNGASRTATISSTANIVAIDVPEFKNVTKFVSNALRYVFYGSRQLELAGLPTAHCLAPHLVHGIEAYLKNYACSIKSTLRDEIKRERWEMMKRSIRDPENKYDSEIILTQSGRSFYSNIQQYLRDVQRVLNPSCATSYLAEVYEAVLQESEELLLHYSTEVVRYLTSSKASSSLRLKQIVGLLTNVAYINDDCYSRSMNIVMEYIPKSVIQSRDSKAKISDYWDKVVESAMKRCADSLLTMSITWMQMDLSDETLPDLTNGKLQLKPLLVGAIFKEVDGASNAQLDRVEAVMIQMLSDGAWWQSFDSSTMSKDRKRLGTGGANKFVAEIKTLQQRAYQTRQLEEASAQIVAKMTKLYEQSHPKSLLASSDWQDAYCKLCACLPSMAAESATT